MSGSVIGSGLPEAKRTQILNHPIAPLSARCTLSIRGSGEDRRVDQRPAAWACRFRLVALLELASPGQSAHAAFLHYEIAAREGHDGVAGEFAALVRRVVAIVVQHRV